MEQELQTRKKKLVSHFLEKGILLSADIVKRLQDQEELNKLYNETFPEAAAVLQDTTAQSENALELERAKVKAEKGDSRAYQELTKTQPTQSEETTTDLADRPCPPVQVDFSYTTPPQKHDVQDFVELFNRRYEALEKVVRAHSEMASPLSIKRLLTKKDREQVTLIGMVYEKSVTKNGNIMFTLEDPTGKIKVLVNKNRQELFNQAQDTVLDEVIGVTGVSGERIVFANSLVCPDVPMREMRQSPNEEYMACISDIHVGSQEFLAKDFDRFLQWINGEIGNEQQRDIASKVKYLFVLGDLVDGVGIYPNQDTEQNLPDIYDQYKEVARLLAKVPQRIALIICPGNHDAMRLSEPQPVFDAKYTGPLMELPNATFVSNPATVTIGKTDDFAGFSVLVYHGYSFDHYVAQVNTLRNNGGYDRADLVMKFLLQRRHLAPTHSSTLYVPDPELDSLVITHPPDFFLSGHIHKSVSTNYRSTTLICSSCWQSKTPFQEKVGHNPEPSRVPLVNLKTREVRMLKFEIEGEKEQ